MGVYKRNGKWEIRFTIRGKPYYRQIPEAANKAQALVAEANLRLEIFEGRYGREQRPTDFADFCRRVYLPDIRNRLKQWRNEEYKVNVLCEFFKGRAIADITPMLVQHYRRARLSTPTQYGRTRQPATVRGELLTLSAIFTAAIENDLAALNPCRKVRWARGTIKSRRDRTLSADEETKLFAELQNYEARRAAIIALNAGLRRMEVLTLNVSRINRAARVACVTGKGGKERLVPLNPAAWGAVEELSREAAPGGWLFHNRTGNNLSARGGAFQSAVRRAGIGDFHFHDLRHTFASRLRLVTDAFTVRDILGHTEADTTDIYITVRQDEMRRAVDALAGGNVLDFKQERRLGNE